MLSLLGALAEFERAIIRERQAEGIAIANAEGRYKGRKHVGVGRSTLYRALQGQK